MPSGVVLLAAGSGHRLGGKRPKQFLDLKGEPLFLRSFRAFLKLPSVKEIVVVCLPRHRSRVQRWVGRFQDIKTIKIIDGGAYRGESVRNGVRALSNEMDVVLVHDSARPLVTPRVIKRVEAASKKYGAALAAWPLADTLKLSSKNFDAMKTIPRRNLWVAQTPQGFRRDVAVACLLSPALSATDDAELAERKGFRVKLVQGTPTNIKVTYPTDLKLCRILCQ